MKSSRNQVRFGEQPAERTPPRDLHPVVAVCQWLVRRIAARNGDTLLRGGGTEAEPRAAPTLRSLGRAAGAALARSPQRRGARSRRADPVFDEGDVAAVQQRFGSSSITEAQLAALARELFRAPAAIVPPDVLVEPIWAYWMDAGGVARAMRAVEARLLDLPTADAAALAEVDFSRAGQVRGVARDLARQQTARRVEHERAAVYAALYGAPGCGNGLHSDGGGEFWPAFHEVLREAVRFLRPSENSAPDAMPLLEVLRRLHVVLGASLSRAVPATRPATALRDAYAMLATGREDLLIGQWLLARPEVSTCFRGLWLVSYAERWMPTANEVRVLLGDSGPSVIHFGELAECGEALILSARFLSLLHMDDSEAAAVWARFWRSEIWRYVGAHRVVTRNLGAQWGDPSLDCEQMMPWGGKWR